MYLQKISLTSRRTIPAMSRHSPINCLDDSISRLTVVLEFDQFEPCI
jgi:hypothetical protein